MYQWLSWLISKTNIRNTDSKSDSENTCIPWYLGILNLLTHLPWIVDAQARVCFSQTLPSYLEVNWEIFFFSDVDFSLQILKNNMVASKGVIFTFYFLLFHFRFMLILDFFEVILISWNSHAGVLHLLRRGARGNRFLVIKAFMRGRK